MFSINKSVSNNKIKRVVTADEVEKYVGKVQSRLQSPVEKKSKAFAFARLYYDARDYETAKKYLEDYLSIQDRDFRVHNLMGQCEEALGNNEGALSSYKRSLELCSTQNDIVVKVISLCIKCSMDPLRAKLWADKGSRICPGHPIVFDLKWHLLESHEPKDFEEMELLLADELARRAREPSLHIKLVNLYMEAGSYKRAFLHCQSVQKTCAFDDNMPWLECACDVFDYHRRCKEDGRISGSLIFALTLCKLMKLHLKHSSTRDCSAVLHRFDKTVKELISHGPVDIFDGLTPEWKCCVTEMKGQLYINTAVYIMKLAQENIISWMKAKRMAVAVLMACWQIDIPQPTSKLFSRHSLLKHHSTQGYDWSTLACSRLSQTGHLLLYLEGLFDIEWLKNCVLDFCTEQGHAALLSNIYPDKSDFVESFLACDPDFKGTEFKMPDINDLLKYDEVAVAEQATDLHHIVWLGLHWDILHEKMKPGVGVIVGRLFEGIALDVKNMNNCYHSSLCLRDIEAFIYCVIRSSKNIHWDCNKSGDSLKLPPVLICPTLVTDQQQDWWQAAYGLYSGKFGTQAVSKLKTIMQKGLETIRCLQNHGIDPRILIYVSLSFWEKGLSIESAKKEECDYKDHWQSLQKRAMHYMKEALRILEIFRSNRTIPLVEHPLILPLSDPLQQEEIALLLNKNYLKLADSAMLGGDLQEALKYYEEVKSLQSFVSQSQIYIRLASGSDRKSIEGEKNHLYYIKKAKEKLSICIKNSDHSPELKQTLINQLHELEATTINSSHSNIPKSKKSLNFQVDIPDADVGIDDSLIYPSNGEIPKELEKSALQEQLDAKESEIKSLKQALAMYKAHIDMQKHYQVVQPVLNNQQPLILQPFPPNAQHRHIRSLDSTTSNTVTPIVQNEIGTPTAPGGLETPSDMWWDSFSPQPSFEKGYFAGLAKHAQQSREEKGEMEAPTLKDSLDPSIDQQTEDSSISLQSQSTVNGGMASSELFTPKEIPNQSSSPAPVSKETNSPKTPTSPAYEGRDIYVEPIVHLTSKSDIVTGEEEETIKFVHRAKLYRFDKEASQWKERGIGDVKLLYNEKTNKSRITMRREQVFRVCCNHLITPEMNLESKLGSKAAWSWFTAADATDEEMKPEQLTIKFKTQETADQFKEAFIECQKMLGKEHDTSPSKLQTVHEHSPTVVSAAPAVNPFVNVSSPVSVISHGIGVTTPTQHEDVPCSFPTSDLTPESYGTQPGGFQFTFASQNESDMLGSMPYSFNGFTFQPQLIPVEGASTLPPSMYSPQLTNDPNNSPAVSASISPIVSFIPHAVIAPNDDFSNISTLPGEVPVSGLTPSTFSGFSFSSKSSESKIPSSLVESESSEAITTNCPMISSLLKDSASAHVQVTPEKPPATTIIEGMNKLPVFEKGLVDISIDPSSFWTSSSPEKPFFTGNTVGLEAIGHKEEPRVVDEDEFMKENAKAADNTANEVYQPEQEMCTYEIFENYEYYGQNGEYYNDDYYDSANDDYDDPDDDFGLENGEDNQPSRASSSRRGSGDSFEEIGDDRPVEDRFDIPKKIPNMNIIDVIDDDLVITMERIPSFAQKLKASRLQLPTTFYLYEAKVTCTGCRGCIEDFDTIPPVKLEEQTVTSSPSSMFSTSYGGSKESTEISFASLASSAPSNFSGSSSGAFSGAGAQLFSSAIGESEEHREHVDDGHDPHYDAIVQLQKVEKIQTGEEDDQVLFKHRAKLYRFDEKWKERGVGDIKLTKNRKTGYCRVIMRRDLIHKLCANHAVMPNMELKPLHTSDSSLVWFTPSDYSEGSPPVPQKLCVKFKKAEIADEFREKFEICKQIMDQKLQADQVESNAQRERENSSFTTKSENVINARSVVQHVSSQESDDLASSFGVQSDGDKSSNLEASAVKVIESLDFRSKFAPKPGSWECPTCMIQNGSGTSKCAACETSNPDLQESVSIPTFVSSDFRSKFAPTPGSWECPTCMIQNGSGTSKCAACETSNPDLQEAVSIPTLVSSDFRSKFAPKPGSWECPTCMIQNGAGTSKCLACETSNPDYDVSNENKADKGFTFGISASQPLFGSNSSNQPSGFTFDSSTSTTTSSFSFGTKTEVTSSSTFSFVTKPEVAISSFSFGSQPEVPSAGFSFGSKPNLSQSPSFNIGWGNENSQIDSNSDKSESSPQNREKVDTKKFEADPNTWECPSCMAKNDGCREVCRTCLVPKEKTPVVTLDPSQFSTPINLQLKNDQSHVSTSKNPETMTFNSANAPMQLSLDSAKSNLNSPFSWDSNANKHDTVLTNNERDKELMPPPKGLPVTNKVSPKQNEKKGITKVESTKVESTNSWLPQGLNLSNLFSFGTTPSPSLSNASSVDDLSQASTLSNVPAAFSGTSFTFKFESPMSAPKTPEQSEESVPAPASPTSPNEYYDEEEANNSIEFSPLVSVVQIKHTSGEEEEVCIFTARSKMFRFDGQWKERGVGEIKILRHGVTDQYRLIMRRDQTHKLCANHGLLNGMSIKPMQGAKKAYVWKTFADISDGDSKEQMFAARFKDEEISDDFREVFEKSCNGEYLTNHEAESPFAAKDVHDVIEISDSEVDEPVVSVFKEISVGYEASIDAELKQKAKDLLLPTSFYHVPTIGLGCTPEQLHTESVEDDSVQPSEDSLNVEKKVTKSGESDDETPQLTLTHERIPNESMELKSEKMLLPKGFYNYEESANLTEENVEVIDEDPIINFDEIYEEMTEYSPFNIDDTFIVIFDEPCSVFRISTATNDYVKLNDGALKVKEDNITKNRNIVLVCDEKVYLCIEITKDTVLVTRADSKNTYDIEAINVAQMKVNTAEKFALKFQDLVTCERFSSVIDETKVYMNVAKSEVTSNLTAFGSRLFGSTTGGITFASIVTDETTAFQDNAGHAFQGAGKTLFTSGVECTNDGTKDQSTEEENIYVEPLVQLESIETSSGEEKECLSFNQRCKLYIFDNTTKKWKERGVGDIKLLQHKENGNCRVVMRRDQVRKLCANHMLLRTTKLEPFKSKELTVTWNAIGDVSNGPPEDCILAARFKNETILEEFKWKFGALCKGESVEPLRQDDELSGDNQPPDVSVIVGSCDPALTSLTESMY